jgi:hypothetical protein
VDVSNQVFDAFSLVQNTFSLALTRLKRTSAVHLMRGLWKNLTVQDGSPLERRLLTFLERFEHLGRTDAKDCIYALAGLADDRFWPNAQNSNSL